MHYLKSTSLAILLATSLTTIPSITNACTRILYAPTDKPVMVGRNMDWVEDMKTNIYVYPAGITRNGFEAVNPIKWTSKYGSVIAAAYDQAATEGLNQMGFTAEVNALRSSDYGVRDKTLPGLSVFMWVQFYLDNFATVAEAVQYTQANPFQIVTVFVPKINENINLHLSVADASGDSAIFEYVNGKLNIYHDKAYNVMTNDPPYDQQLVNLKQYQGFGGDKSLPGTTNASDRFVRASYYLNHLPTPNSTREEVSEVFSILHNAEQPYGVPSAERPIVGYSIWRTVEDLSNKVYYFDSLTNLNVFYVQLAKLNLAVGAPVMKLDVANSSDLVGDVSDKFKPVG